MTHPEQTITDIDKRSHLRSPGVGGPVSQVVHIRDESDIGLARRSAARVAADAHMSENDAGALALVTTEAANNIARYGRDGLIILRSIGENDEKTVEMIAADKGPGIADLNRAFSDGYSTGGTPGKGLGAIKRMSRHFDMWSIADGGTSLVARFGAKVESSALPSDIGVVCSSLAGETSCGDAWMVEETPEGTLIALADGLGHGHDAAIAADTAIDLMRRRKRSSLIDILQLTHNALRSTRGAAIQIAVVERGKGTVRSAGVGNISASVITRGAFKGVPSQPGIVGHQMPTVREVTLPWERDSVLVMHSDGISAKWKIDSYPGIAMRDPALLAAVIYRDSARARDDATVVTYRATAAGDAR